MTYFYRSGAECTDTISQDAKGRPVANLVDVCPRCGGTGTYLFYISNTHGVCWGCSGTGKKQPRAERVYTAEQLAKLNATAAKREERARVKRLAAQRIERIAVGFNQFMNRRRFRLAFPALVEALDIVGGDFAASLWDSVEIHGELTDGQAAAIMKSAREVELTPEPAPVLTGKQVIEGRVLMVKWYDNAYGGTFKMLVVDDRGFKVFGTVARSLECVEKGDRVVFTATVEVSDNEPTFGYYRRPTKARLLTRNKAHDGTLPDVY